MKFITDKKCLGLGELVYLQSKRCDVNISHHAGHLFSFKNLGGVLHEHQTRSESWFEKTHVRVMKMLSLTCPAPKYACFRGPAH